MLKAVVDSNFAIDFDPFIDYFLSLRPWDGKTDYIKQLAATVTTNDPDFWEDSLRRWLVWVWWLVRWTTKKKIRKCYCCIASRKRKKDIHP